MVRIARWLLSFRVFPRTIPATLQWGIRERRNNIELPEQKLRWPHRYQLSVFSLPAVRGWVAIASSFTIASETKREKVSAVHLHVMRRQSYVYDEKQQRFVLSTLKQCISFIMIVDTKAERTKASLEPYTKRCCVARFMMLRNTG